MDDPHGLLAALGGAVDAARAERKAARAAGSAARLSEITERYDAGGEVPLVDVGWLLGEVAGLNAELDEMRGTVGLWHAQADNWQARAEADHAKLEQVAELVQQWRAKGAEADFLNVTSVWDRFADQLTEVLASEAGHATAETIRYTADVVLLTEDGRVLLIQRGYDPYAGMWAFPGGHVDKNETALGAAFRELEEETGIRFEGALQGVGVYDAPGRDPRGRYVTTVYAATIPEAIHPVAGDDAKQARWWPLNDLPPLAFDHAEIIADVIAGPAGRG